MLPKRVRSQNSALCLMCKKVGKVQPGGVLTNYTDGTYSWKCDLFPAAHHGTGVWPVGSPAWHQATGK